LGVGIRFEIVGKMAYKYKLMVKLHFVGAIPSLDTVPRSMSTQQK
jgi:hypothetical protein